MSTVTLLNACLTHAYFNKGHKTWHKFEFGTSNLFVIFKKHMNLFLNFDKKLIVQNARIGTGPSNIYFFLRLAYGFGFCVVVITGIDES